MVYQTTLAVAIETGSMGVGVGVGGGGRGGRERRGGKGKEGGGKRGPGRESEVFVFLTHHVLCATTTSPLMACLPFIPALYNAAHALDVPCNWIDPSQTSCMCVAGGCGR